MNFWGFTPFIFQILESSFYRFLEKENLDDSQEFYLPQAIQEYCNKKDSRMSYKIFTLKKKAI